MDLAKATCSDNSRFPYMWSCRKVIGGDLFVPPGASLAQPMENWMTITFPQGRPALVHRVKVTQVARIMKSAQGSFAGCSSHPRSFDLI